MMSRKTLRTLLGDTLDARTVPLSADLVAARTAALRDAFHMVDHESDAHERGLATLPRHRQDGWRRGLLAALDLMVGIPPRSSRIRQALASPFAAQAIAWRLDAVAPALSRADGAASRAATADGDMIALVDDSGEERRIIVTIRAAPGLVASPVMVLIDRDGVAPAIEIDPETIEDDGPRRLRYEAVIRPGAYSVAFGNPRDRSDAGA